MSDGRVTRRVLLQAGTLTAIGLALPSCHPSDTIRLDLDQTSAFAYFEPHQAAIVMDLADLMIPTTETPGAADSHTALYLDQLMLTWAGNATRIEIEGFIETFAERAETEHQARYLDLAGDIRLAYLRDIDAASFAAADEDAFAKAYRRLKRLIFHIHYSSEAANPDFVLIPGQYRGDVSESEYLALVEDNRY